MKTTRILAILVLTVGLVTSTSAELPPGWYGVDTGYPEVPGSAHYDSATKTWILEGANSSSHYVYTSLQGDGQITARIVSSSSWASVAIREDLTRLARYATLGITPRSDADPQPFATFWTTRPEDMPDDVSIGGLPYWVRLERRGDEFTGYISPNGNPPWTWVGREYISMGTATHIGLLVGSYGTAEFSDVNVEGGGSDEPDDDWMVSDSNMYSIPVGNVGIGTTSPDAKLDVDGTVIAKAGNANAAIISNTSSEFVTLWITSNRETNAIWAKNSASGSPTILGENSNSSGYAGYFKGHLGCTGFKPATVETQSYGNRNLYADESAEIYFFDRGLGKLTNGSCVIDIDPMFLETVTINDSYPMLVQITLTADCKGVFVSDKTNSSFTVKELQGGISNATFDWEVCAKRKGYEDIRMESITFVTEPPVEALRNTAESSQERIGSTGRSIHIIKGE